jgi:hypothetical protein
MRLGKVVGSPKEIRNLIEDSGLKIPDYLEKPERQIGTIWFIVPPAIVLIAATISVLIPAIGPSGRVLAFVVGSGASIWLSVNVHIRFKSAWAASTIVIGAIALLLVSAGLVAPLDMLKQLREIRK